jgi:hypothetical protein
MSCPVGNGSRPRSVDMSANIIVHRWGLLFEARLHKPVARGVELLIFGRYAAVLRGRTRGLSGCAHGVEEFADFKLETIALAGKRFGRRQHL